MIRLSAPFTAALLLLSSSVAQAGTFPPYQAVVEETISNAESREVHSAWQARDSDGRVYTDKGQTIVIFDPVNRTKTTLYVQDEVAETHVIPPDVADRYLSGEMLAPHLVPYEMRVKDLGTRVIEGLEATGRLASWNQGDCVSDTGLCMQISTEVWFVEELGIRIESHTTVRYVNENASTTRSAIYTRVDVAEPDPALFRIPEGYTIK